MWEGGRKGREFTDKDNFYYVVNCSTTYSETIKNFISSKLYTLECVQANLELFSTFEFKPIYGNITNSMNKRGVT